MHNGMWLRSFPLPADVYCHESCLERFLLDGSAAKSNLTIIVKMYGNKHLLFGLNLRLGLGIRVSSVVRVKVRFKI